MTTITLKQFIINTIYEYNYNDIVGTDTPLHIYPPDVINLAERIVKATSLTLENILENRYEKC